MYPTPYILAIYKIGCATLVTEDRDELGLETAFSLKKWAYLNQTTHSRQFNQAKIKGFLP